MADKLNSNSSPVEGCSKSVVVPNSPPVEGCPAGRGGSSSQPRNTKIYMSLPYNSDLKERAKILRKAGNLSEVLLWQQIKSKQLNGLDFDRQKIIGSYIVDFYCASRNVIVEIDGSSHDNKVEYDKERDAYLSALGLTVIHILDTDVKQNLAGVMKVLEGHSALGGTTPAFGHPSTGGTTPAFGHPSTGGTTPAFGHPSTGGELVRRRTTTSGRK